MRPILGIARHALPVVLMLSLLPAAALAESLVCHSIRRGESATQVARRVTGDSRNTYRASFQIMNASSRFIPKSQYDSIRAGWRACVIKPAVAVALDAPASTIVDVRAAAPDASAIAEPVQRPDVIADPAPSPIVRAIAPVDLTVMWLGVAMVVPWFGWRVLDDYLARRRTAAVVVRHYADRFVSEFERPLLKYDSAEHPLRSRLRYGARQRRFDILLAPGEGRRYPNLSDHKKNVEYDVGRVVSALADESFVCGPLYTQAGWVVVPFQFEAGSKQAGVTCISSF